jgi:hypothetical protein
MMKCLEKVGIVGIDASNGALYPEYVYSLAPHKCRIYGADDVY